MIDEKKCKAAILWLKEARKAVLKCGADAECWIVRNIDESIEVLRLEMEDWRRK